MAVYFTDNEACKLYYKANHLLYKMTTDNVIRQKLLSTCGPMNEWFLYIIEADDHSLYTGITTDIERRFKEHCDVNCGVGRKGAKFFLGRKPVRVAYRESHRNRSAASKRESQIKSWSRNQKVTFIACQTSGSVTQ